MLAAALALMLLAQWLGLVHAVVHPAVHAVSQAAAPTTVAAGPAAPGRAVSTAARWLHELVASHVLGSAGCQGLHQLGHGAPALELPDLPDDVMAPAGVAAAPASATPRIRRGRVQARAPPLLA